MIAPAWLARLLPIPKTGKISIYDPITGEEAVIISKRLLCDKIREAYEAGANDQYNGISSNHSRDEFVNDLTEELYL